MLSKPMTCALAVILVGCGGGSGEDSAMTTDQLAEAQAKPGTGGPCNVGKNCFTIGGTISGLGDVGLTLVNGTESVAVAALATTFTFPTPLAKKANYAVSALLYPRGYGCAVTNGTGVIDKANVNSVSVNCAQSVVTTFAGSGAPGFVNGTGTSASFDNPQGAATDSAGNVYLSDTNNHAIRKITPAGVVTTFAGTGVQGADDGPASSATFAFPQGVAVDSAGNVYVADILNHKIRRISATGTVTTLAGSGVAAYADGNGISASFNFPTGVAVDAAGNVFVADRENFRIRKIAPNGDVTTLVGNGVKGTTDGPGAVASFDLPVAIARDLTGNLYVSEFNGQVVRKVTAAGVVSTLAGSPPRGDQDGVGATAKFFNPYGIAVDASGNLFVGDFGNHRVRRITPSGAVSTVAGSGIGQTVDGNGTQASFYVPIALALRGNGMLVVVDRQSNFVREVLLPPY